jgi:hypothetical protein
VGYEYEDLDDSQFERLVVQVMRKLCGSGVQSFATGPDGGRDARFHGTAERFPSTTAPWMGKTVGQAKHTNSINAHFSDPDFSGLADGSTLSEELRRIKSLAESDEVDNYILFSNRRLGGTTAPALIKRISEGSGIPEGQIFLAGVEYLDEMIHEYPDLIRLARINPVDGPLIVSSRDCAEVILAVSAALAAPLPALPAEPVDRVSYNEKNAVNGMTSEFAKVLSKRYLVLTRQIEQFLADPGNSETREQYEAAVDDFQLKIVAHRAEYRSFDHVFNYLVDLLMKRDGVLARHKRLTRALVFYMYWHCDIGETPDAAAE